MTIPEVRLLVATIITSPLAGWVLWDVKNGRIGKTPWWLWVLFGFVSAVVHWTLLVLVGLAYYAWGKSET